MEYKFREVTKTDAGVEINLPDEGFSFAGFDSMATGWWLLERNAPAPAEQEIVETVPYAQGELDFSMLGGERYFRVREITYKLLAIDRYYDHRKGVEQELKRQLMRTGYGKLNDTHDTAYYWWAKCKSVEVDDDVEKSSLTATVTFKAYPFAYTNHDEGADYWDDVVFAHWIWQPTKFDVNGDQDVTIKNIGSRPVICTFEVAGTVKVATSSQTIDLTADNYKGQELLMEMGDNRFHLSGSGSIHFVFRREELI